MPTTNYTVFDGEIVEEDRNGTVRGYVPDPQGNTVALLDSSQNITDEWEYWPYGEVKSHAGPSPTPFTYIGVFGYHTDPTGLTYVRARYYNAPNGQWQTMDPLWPWEDAYAYCRQSPTSKTDRSGMRVSHCYRPVLSGWGPSATPPYFQYYVDWSEGHSHPYLRTSRCGVIGMTGSDYGIVISTVNDPKDDAGWCESINSADFSPKCRDLNLTDAQERCLCDIARNAQRGWFLCGKQWRREDYDWSEHNSQHFIIALLYKCTSDKKHLEIPHLGDLPFDPADCFESRATR